MLCRLIATPSVQSYNMYNCHLVPSLAFLLGISVCVCVFVLLLSTSQHDPRPGLDPLERRRPSIVTVPALGLGAERLVLLSVRGVQHHAVVDGIAQLRVSLKERLVATVQQVDLGVVQGRVRVLIAQAVVTAQEAESELNGKEKVD